MNYFERAKELLPETKAHRCYIHKLAETGLETMKTAEYVESELRKCGIEPKRIGKAGVTALIGSGSPVFLLRADMDALPMPDESGLPFAATNGNCHACGHDFHASMLLTAAKLLKENESQLKGTVKLMFQPGEEIFQGAKDMIANGILENPHVDAAMAIHVSCNDPVGMLTYNTGVITSSCDAIKITVKGKGAHGASAYRGVDPINAIVQIYQAIQAMLTREVNSLDVVSLTFGQIHGGEASNIIPDEAFMVGTLRTYDENVRKFVLERVNQIAKGVATSFRAEAVIEYPFGVGSLNCDAETAECASDALRELYEDKVYYARNLRINGSEDFAAFAAEVPSVFFGLSTGKSPYPTHNPGVVFNEEAMPYGASAYAHAATRWLEAHAEKNS